MLNLLKSLAQLSDLHQEVPLQHRRPFRGGYPAVGELIETIGEEIIQPTVRYGRGLRHGLLIGAGIAILVTPWPGAVVREKLKAFGREAMDLVDAMRAGVSEA